MPAQDTSKGKTVFWVVAERDGKHVMEGIVEDVAGSTLTIRPTREWWAGGNARLPDAKLVRMGTLFFDQSLEELLRDDDALWHTILSILRP